MICPSQSDFVLGSRMQFSDKISDKWLAKARLVFPSGTTLSPSDWVEPRVFAMSLRSMKGQPRLSVLARLWMESRFQPYFG